MTQFALEEIAAWKLGFSYGRALQDAALATWRGSPDNVDAAQRVFQRRARFV